MTRAVLLASLAGLLLAQVLFVWLISIQPGGFFGSDLVAYREAATRLSTTGTPYHPLLFLGPIENRAENVSIGYLYPPPLAQLFTIFADVPRPVVAFSWAAFQVVLLALLLPQVYRANGGRLDSAGSLFFVWLAVTTVGLQLALVIGNLSGWIAIGVAVMLLAPPRVQGPVAAAMTVLKLLPIPLLIAALVARSTRQPAVVFVVIVVGISVLLSPASWGDWVRLLPNLSQTSIASAPANIGPAGVLGRVGLGSLGAGLGAATAIACGALAVWRARGEHLTSEAIAAAAVAYIFVSATVWEHYPAVLVPLIIAGWPTSGSRRRAGYVLLAVSQASILWGVGVGPVAQAAIQLAGLIIGSSALVAGPLGVQRPRVGEGQVDPLRAGAPV